MKSKLFLTLLSGSFSNILEKLVIDFGDPVAKYLLAANEKIKNKDESIKTYITDYCRQITLKQNSFEVTFLPKYCDPVFSETNNWLKKNRQSGKPGKIIQKLIGKGKFSNAEYEQFVYHLKAIWNNRGYDVKLVKGEDIRKWYLDDNYFLVQNTLGNSCMRYEECQPYFDIYCEQPECQMLIALKEGKLAGRALVWTLETITFLDRVYYIEDCIYSIFKEYAISNKWAIRNDNCLLSDGDDQIFLTNDDNYSQGKRLELELHLNKQYPYYPYIDTFRYLNLSSQTLYSYIPCDITNIAKCSSTEGGFNKFTEDCPNCGEPVTEDELAYSDYYDMYGCDYCMCYSNIMEDFILSSESVRVFTNSGIQHACEDWLIQYPDEYVKIKHTWYSTDYVGVHINEDGVYEIKFEN